MLVAIEGIDGSGKGTQARLLTDRLLDLRIPVVLFSFPNYGANPFGVAVGRYLNGSFGQVGDVAPELAAVLFAGDRFASRRPILDHLCAGKVVLCDRYVASNLAHQAAKLSVERRAAFVEWLTSIEYGLFDMPKPDITLYLELPVPVASQLVAQKNKRVYTDLAADIHESDQGYLAECQAAYRDIMALDHNGQLERIECCDSGPILRPAEVIANDIWARIGQRLQHSHPD